MFDFVKHNDKQSQFVWKFESSIRPRYIELFIYSKLFTLFLYYLCITRAELDSQYNVSLELREFPGNIECDGCCYSDHNTGSDPPPHARGEQTSHQSHLWSCPSHNSGHTVTLYLSDFLASVLFSLTSLFVVISELLSLSWLTMAREMASCCFFSQSLCSTAAALSRLS